MKTKHLVKTETKNFVDEKLFEYLIPALDYAEKMGAVYGKNNVEIYTLRFN